MSNKRRKKKQFYGMVFAPIFPTHMGTPKTTPDAPLKVESCVNLTQLVEMVAGAGPSWTGYGVPNIFQVYMKHDSPGVSGPGFQPVEPGQGGRYNFRQSPGLGFKTEAGWRVWNSVLEILPKAQLMSVTSILQAAMQRAGVKIGDVDTSECRLLEMGIEWYWSDPGKNPQPKDSTGGLPGGVPFGALKSGAS
jgi:hypothetical protein